MDRLDAQALFDRQRLGKRLAVDVGGHSAHELEQPGAAGIDDARVAQHLQLVGGPGDRCLPALDKPDEQLREERLR